LPAAAAKVMPKRQLPGVTNAAECNPTASGKSRKSFSADEILGSSRVLFGMTFSRKNILCDAINPIYKHGYFLGEPTLGFAVERLLLTFCSRSLCSEQREVGLGLHAPRRNTQHTSGRSGNSHRQRAKSENGFNTW